MGDRPTSASQWVENHNGTEWDVMQCHVRKKVFLDEVMPEPSLGDEVNQEGDERF